MYSVYRIGGSCSGVSAVDAVDGGSSLFRASSVAVPQWTALKQLWRSAVTALEIRYQCMEESRRRVQPRIATGHERATQLPSVDQSINTQCDRSAETCCAHSGRAERKQQSHPWADSGTAHQDCRRKAAATRKIHFVVFLPAPSGSTTSLLCDFLAVPLYYAAL